MIKLTRFLLFALGALWLQGAAQAALTIEVNKGVQGAVPIAIVPFGNAGRLVLPEDVSEIVANDLEGSGRFAPLQEEDLVATPHTGQEVNFSDWKLLNTENLVIGDVRPSGPGQYIVQFQLFNVFQGKQLAGFSFPGRAEDLRKIAHNISDIIFEKLTGERGAFSTRIAYVAVSGSGPKSRSYSLQVADADGHNPRTVVSSKEPILSPAWSPDGARLAYLSFEKKRAQIYVQEISSGRRELVASYPGLNGAPAFSPDGRRLALTLSKDGNPEIYVLNLATKALVRLTQNPAIDTEPNWAPDGQSMIFTSDRGGRPQLYRMSAGGGSAERLTFDGNYNARGVFSPNGQQVTMVQGNGSTYRIAVLDLASGESRILSEASLDESPSFSPNGNMIIYATNDGDRGVLARVSADGKVSQRLTLDEGDVREAVWSPFSAKIDSQL